MNIERDAKILIRKAIEAQRFAYAPYSNFQVGAALLCEGGEIYTGCNVENAAYPAGNCAERTAVFKAVSEGKRKFSAIAIVGNKSGNEREECAPCGICRQVLSEFADGDFPIIIGKSEEEYRTFKLEELLPLRFSKHNLQ